MTSYSTPLIRTAVNEIGALLTEQQCFLRQFLNQEGKLLQSHNEVTYLERKDFIAFNSLDKFILQQTPDFLDYLFFHNVLDKYCWLIKLHYSDRETVKSKRHRIDILFQRFLLINKFNLPKAAKCLSADLSADILEYHLTKGWHNELVRSDPLHSDYLNIGTQLSVWDGPGSGGLAAWNIIQSYYAFFEYISCICATINPTLVSRGHKKIANAFNNQVQGVVSDRILFYPFSLSSETPAAQIPQHPDFCRFHYAFYPREPGGGIHKLEYEVQKAFALLANGSKRSILDLLYELRLWGNYTGVQSLLKLSDGGYQKFLSMNLATVVFFAAGMAELAVLAALGREGYMSILRKFSTIYIDKHERFAGKKFLIPSYIRLRSYVHLGIIEGPIDFIIPKSADPVRFVDI